MFRNTFSWLWEEQNELKLRSVSRKLITDDTIELTDSKVQGLIILKMELTVHIS